MSKASWPCPAGTELTGGGALTNSLNPHVSLTDDYPSGNAWVVDYNNESNQTVYMYTAAVCSSPIAGYAVDEGSQLRVAAGVGTTASLRCPGAEVALGGGLEVNTLNPNVNLGATAPEADGLGWTNYEVDGTTAAAGLNPWVLCGSVSTASPAAPAS